MAQRTIYIPDHLTEKFDAIDNKSEFVRKAIDNENVTKQDVKDALKSSVHKLHFYEPLDQKIKMKFIEAATELLESL